MNKFEQLLSVAHQMSLAGRPGQEVQGVAGAWGTLRSDVLRGGGAVAGSGPCLVRSNASWVMAT